MAFESVNYQCPACGGPLHFASAEQKLVCDYCDSRFEVEEVEALYRERQDKADAKADADGIDEVLHGKDQGHSRHGLFTDHGDEQAVDDIIERIDDHRHDGRQGHRSDERQNRPFFHKRFVHTSPSAAVAQPAPEGSSAFDDQVEDEDIH